MDKKNIQCDIKITNGFEFNCIDSSKGKPAKHFFPFEIRRIVHCAPIKGSNEVLLRACTTRKNGKEGSKWKKLYFTLESSSQASKWADSVMAVTYGGKCKEITKVSYSDVSARGVLVLYDKYESKKVVELLEKFMKPVLDHVGKPIEFKGLK